MQIADGVFFLRGRSGERIRRGVGSPNVTVIRGDALVLVDAGVIVGGALADLHAAAEADGLALEDAAWILLTHGHWDHVNAAGALSRRSGARLGAGEDDVPMIEDSERNFAGFVTAFGEHGREISPLPGFLMRLLARFAWGAQPQLHVDRVLHDGDVVDVGRPIEVLALPGHTRGHLGFFVRDAGVLALGDLIDFENAFGLDLNTLESDYEAGVASLRRALALEPEALVCGHGAVAVGRAAARAVIERALSGALAYPERVRRALGARPLRLAEIARRAFPARGLAFVAAARTLTLNMLLYLERRGAARRADRGGRPAWIRGEGALD